MRKSGGRLGGGQSSVSLTSSIGDDLDTACCSSLDRNNVTATVPGRTSIFGNSRRVPSTDGTGAQSILDRIPFLSTFGSTATASYMTPSTDLYDYHVTFLDDTQHRFTLKRQSPGGDLLNQVFQYLNLHESQYFGLLVPTTTSSDNPKWLCPQRNVRKQLKGHHQHRTIDYPLVFRVRYFPPAPIMNYLNDQLTRHLFVLQLRQDLKNGNLYASQHTLLHLCALCLQCDRGSYDGLNIRNSGILRSLPIPDERIETLFAPSPQCILELTTRYKHLPVTMSVADTECEFLNIVGEHLDMYGYEFHSAYVKVSASPSCESVEVRLGVGHGGLVIFQEYQRISRFVWSRITKVSYTHRRLIIRLSTDLPNDEYPARLLLLSSKDDHVIWLYFRSYTSCRSAYQACIEQHAFMKSLSEQPKNGIVGIDGSNCGAGGAYKDSISILPIQKHPKCHLLLNMRQMQCNVSAVQPSGRPKCHTMECNPFPRTILNSPIPLPPRSTHNNNRSPTPPLPASRTSSQSSLYDIHFESIDAKTSIDHLRDGLDSTTGCELLFEFENLYRAKPGYTFEASKRLDNVSKNRYKDILAYDQTRVKLKTSRRVGDEKSDYINAN
ncbi:hypothetical protein ACOME3_001420 [Neoechinorhynchus agilis]